MMGGLSKNFACVPYRQEEAAVLLHSTHESQERQTGDDDASDQQYVGEVEAGQFWGESGHPEVHQQIDTRAEHGYTAHLPRDSS